MPENPIIIKDYINERKTDHVQSNTYLKNVKCGTSTGDEFIIAGNEDDIYRPDILLWLKFKFENDEI